MRRSRSHSRSTKRKGTRRSSNVKIVKVPGKTRVVKLTKVRNRTPASVKQKVSTLTIALLAGVGLALYAKSKGYLVIDSSKKLF